VPRASRPVDPGTSGRMRDSSNERTDCPLSSAITSWKLGYFSYGTPPPRLRQSTMSPYTPPGPMLYWVNTAMLSAATAGVRHTAGSADKTKCSPDGWRQDHAIIENSCGVSDAGAKPIQHPRTSGWVT
jgi:hypothetical protein